MISTTVQHCREAHRALRALNDIKLPATVAWRFARLINKVKAVVLDFETTQLKIYIDNGGIPSGNGVTILEPVRGNQTDEEWDAVVVGHREKIGRVGDAIVKLMKEPVEIDFEKISIDLFADTPVSVNDLADLEAFLEG